jgi:hypothetical protein
MSASPNPRTSAPSLEAIDLVLFGEALRLMRTAQRIRSEPLEKVVDRLSSGGLVAHAASSRRAALAANRAGARGARWFGWLDTCLTKSLTAGGLLARRRRVVLRVGFRPGGSMTTADGHAWLGVDDEDLQLSAPPDLGPNPYSEVLEIPFSRTEGLE